MSANASYAQALAIEHHTQLVLGVGNLNREAARKNRLLSIIKPFTEAVHARVQDLRSHDQAALADETLVLFAVLFKQEGILWPHITEANFDRAEKRLVEVDKESLLTDLAAARAEIKKIMTTLQP